jgi:hypothetical protein
MACSSIPNYSHTEDFSFLINDEGNIVITEYIGKNTDVVIPEIINDKKVVEISGFYYDEEVVVFMTSFNRNKNTDIKSITIPKTVIKVNKNAFRGYKRLQNIILQDDDVRSLRMLFMFEAGSFSYSDPKIIFTPERKLVNSIYNGNGNILNLVSTINLNHFPNYIWYESSLELNGKILCGPFGNENKAVDVIIENISNNILLVNISNITFLIKNGELYSELFSEIQILQMDENENIYYIGKSKNNNVLYKNNSPLANNIHRHDISNNGLNYAYTKIFNESIYNSENLYCEIYINGQKYYQTTRLYNGIISFLIFCPDNENIIFEESYTINRETIKYIHYKNITYGPYRLISENKYFTDDKKYFIFEHRNPNEDWKEERIEL